MVEPKTEIDRRLDRVELAISTVADRLGLANTGNEGLNRLSDDVRKIFNSGKEVKEGTDEQRNQG